VYDDFVFSVANIPLCWTGGIIVYREKTSCTQKGILITTVVVINIL